MLRRFALPIAVYLALALVLTWPLAANPHSQVVGAVRSDAWNSLWNLWFVHDALVDGRSPFFTTLLAHPAGGRIVVADPLNTLLGYPLVSLFGVVETYALLVVLHSAFAGLAAHALGRALGGRGWIAGVGYQLAPIIVSHLHNGSSEAIAAGWLPLAALALWRVTESPTPRRVVAAGVALAVCAIGGWYAGVGAWCVVVGIFLFHRPIWRQLALTAGLALLLTLPVAKAVRDVARADDGLVEIKGGADLARLRRTIGPSDPRTFFAPGSFRSPDFPHLQGAPSDYVHTTYLGYVLLTLALVGLWRRPEGRRSGPWLVAGLMGVVMALGPVVVIDGFPLAIRGRAIPLPYLAIEGLPGFNTLSLLYRIAGVSAMSLAVLADRAIVGRLSPLFALLVGLETALVSPAHGLPAVSNVPHSPALQELAAAPDGAIINLPIAASRTYMFEQTVHHKPLASSLNTGANQASLRVLTAARRVKAGLMSTQDVADVALGERVRYVVIHKNLLITEPFTDATSVIRQSFPLIAEDATVRVYALY